MSDGTRPSTSFSQKSLCSARPTSAGVVVVALASGCRTPQVSALSSQGNGGSEDVSLRSPTSGLFRPRIWCRRLGSPSGSRSICSWRFSVSSMMRRLGFSRISCARISFTPERPSVPPPGDTGAAVAPAPGAAGACAGDPGAAGTAAAAAAEAAEAASASLASISAALELSASSCMRTSSRTAARTSSRDSLVFLGPMRRFTAFSMPSSFRCTSSSTARISSCMAAGSLSSCSRSPSCMASADAYCWMMPAARRSESSKRHLAKE
mmetsp:Transcript_1539/g.4202  ORF Transcript_1539/g.4202 Transcript_1539/m.4202 type:complete len:265 (+) Transcript_1539:325-1119(+)